MIEHAKGLLAERMDTTVDNAFTLLRDHARTTGMRLAKVARAVVAGFDLPGPTTAP